MEKPKSKKEEFLFFLENIVPDMLLDLEGSFICSVKDLPNDQRDRHLCACSASVRATSALLNIVLRAFKDLHKIDYKKCCEHCEKGVNMLGYHNSKDGTGWYEKEYTCLENKELYPDYVPNKTTPKSSE